MQGGVDAAHLASQQLHGNEPFRAAVALLRDDLPEFERIRELTPRQLATEVHDTIALPDADSGTARPRSCSPRQRAIRRSAPTTTKRDGYSLSPIIGPDNRRTPSATSKMSPRGVGRDVAWPVLAMTYQTLGDESQARRWLDRSAWWLACHHPETPTDAPRIFEPGVLNPSEWLNASVFYREAKQLIEVPQRRRLPSIPTSHPPRHKNHSRMTSRNQRTNH